MPKKKIVASTTEQQVLKISTVRTLLQEKLHAVHFVVYGAFKRVMDLTIFEKIEYDLEYVENYSLMMDMKAIFITVMTVFTGEGVDAGKAGIHDDIRDLKRRNRKRVVNYG